MKGKHVLWPVLALLVGLSAGVACGANTFTLYDDGDPLYNDGIYDLGGRGRPAAAATASGEPYSGQEYLTVWGDTIRDPTRNSSRVSAFFRSDTGLDMSQDWWISMDVANDLVSPDIGMTVWLLDFQPDSTFLNSGWGHTANATFVLFLGDQFAGEDGREGFHIMAYRTTGRTNIEPFRLDPDPDITSLRGGHNRVTIEWLAASQTYRWTISNINGTLQATESASNLTVSSPTTQYIAAGTWNNNAWMCSGWTVWDMSYGQGQLPGAVRFTIELAGSGTATVGGSPAADGGVYSGDLQLVGQALNASDASFVKTGELSGAGWAVHGNCESQYGSGQAYSHQIMSSGWSGQPEAYSGVPSSLMLQIISTNPNEVSLAYVDATGTVKIWNESTKAWQAGTNYLDIALNGGNDDIWWIAYDGTNYWLSVSNGTDVRTAKVAASEVRNGGSTCYFAAGRPWTTGWGKTADFTINTLTQLPYFSEPPLSTGPFVLRLGGAATATINGFPAADGATYDGTTALTASGSDPGADAAFIKTPLLGHHPWTVVVDFESLYSGDHIFSMYVKDPAWSGDPETPVPPASTKMVVIAENSPECSAVYLNDAGGGYWYDLIGGVWNTRPTRLEVAFDGFWDDSVAIGYDGAFYHFRASNGAVTRTGAAPGATTDPMRQQAADSYVAIGDLSTSSGRSNFTIYGARLLPYFDRSLFPANQEYRPPAMTIGEAKQLPDGAHVQLVGDIVTMSRPDLIYGLYYAQEPDKSSGIQVWSPLSLDRGTVRSILGVMSVEAGERLVFEDTFRSSTTGTETPPLPLGVAGRSLGGGGFGNTQGVELGSGLNNLGLLVRTWGKVSYVAPDNSYFLVDDGSGVAEDPAGAGIRVPAALAGLWPPDAGSYVAVAGVARPYIRSDGLLGREIMPRDADDLQVLAGP